MCNDEYQSLYPHENQPNPSMLSIVESNASNLVTKCLDGGTRVPAQFCRCSCLWGLQQPRANLCTYLLQRRHLSRFLWPKTPSYFCATQVQIQSVSITNWYYCLSLPRISVNGYHLNSAGASACGANTSLKPTVVCICCRFVF